MSSIRGLRNNNPGNIKEMPGDTTKWVGERATDDDPLFEEFDTMAHGIRALAILLKNYRTIHGLRTVRQIINRWAPPSDNNPTLAYENYVATVCAVKPDEIIDVMQFRMMRNLVVGICQFENGRDIFATGAIKNSDLIAGLNMAGFKALPTPDVSTEAPASNAGSPDPSGTTDSNNNGDQDERSTEVASPSQGDRDGRGNDPDLRSSEPGFFSRLGHFLLGWLFGSR